MHCHSTASQESRLGVQRALGLPECATPPEEVYELAKRRGMDFVTITDHDTITGVLEIADRPDVFVSEELTALLRRAVSPSLIRAGSLLCGGTMRLDLHPADLEHPRYMMALEWVLGRAGHRREAITYDELVATGI